MSDEDRPDDPIPGWPGAPVSGPPPGSTPPPTGPPSPPPGYQQPGYPPPGYPPPGYPPPGYPSPGYGYGYGYGATPTQDHPQGTLILVLGILSIVVCGLLGPVAWFMGTKALKEIDANPAAYGNRGNVQAGRIIGIVATCILAFVIVIYAFLAVFIGVASVSSS